MSGGQFMVVMIVAIVMIASIFKTRLMHGQKGIGDEPDDAERQRLKQEVKELKERLQVLERIATDRENSLSREIEQLRDR